LNGLFSFFGLPKENAVQQFESPRQIEREARVHLRRLAAAGTYLVAAPGAGSRWQLMSQRNAYARPVDEWEGRLVKSFEQHGWIERAPLGRQVLSDGGRHWLAGRGIKVKPADARAAAPAAHHRSAQEPGGGGVVLVNDAESPLAWLASRKGPDGRPLLSQQMFDAGERLRRDFEAGQMSDRVTAQWGTSIMPRARGRSGTPDQGLTRNERALAARQRVWQALQHAGPGLSSVLLEVCCLASGLEAAERHLNWPKRSAKLVLVIALERLADYYFAPSRQRGSSRSEAKVWGLDDYRPELFGHLEPAPPADQDN
jgi:hypothetical protein